MKPMMIASYLGSLHTVVCNLPEHSKEDAHIQGMLQALREAQMYFYELARQDMLREMGYEETEGTV